jgi:hypothetical protein
MMLAGEPCRRWAVALASVCVILARMDNANRQSSYFDALHNDPTFVESRSNAAAADLAGFGKGQRRIGWTGGQYSMIDLIRASLAFTGPADVIVSTWSSGIRDGESAAYMLETGLIRRMTWLVDASFFTRSPGYVERLERRFGPDCVIATLIHAKFAVIRNEEWSLAFRSSMNLNRNNRLELWEVDDSPLICDWLQGLVDELARTHDRGWRKDQRQAKAEFLSMFERDTEHGGQAAAVAESAKVAGWFD